MAVLLLIHHALTDGIGILRMLNNFWQTRPEALEHPEPVEWRPVPLPSRWRLLLEGLRDLPGVVAANLPGAIRSLLCEQYGTAPTAPMVATVPFSLVPLEQQTRDGNFSTTCHTLLHTDIADPVGRLRACKRSADTMKAYFEATREANLTAVLKLLPAGYYKDPEKTAMTFRVVDGKRFAFIGDWGQWNVDGTLQLLGRGSACINTGGEKVYPEEVEHVILAHPDVADCLVIGMPDERFGQKVVALVASRSGRSGCAAELNEFVQGKMAGYKRPRAFLEVSTIPRLPDGKADYKAAKTLAGDRMP